MAIESRIRRKRQLAKRNALVQASQNSDAFDGNVSIQLTDKDSRMCRSGKTVVVPFCRRRVRLIQRRVVISPDRRARCRRAKASPGWSMIWPNRNRSGAAKFRFPFPTATRRTIVMRQLRDVAPARMSSPFADGVVYIAFRATNPSRSVEPIPREEKASSGEAFKKLIAERKLIDVEIDHRGSLSSARR